MDKEGYIRPNYEVLEEDIEDDYQPTQEELIEYAEWLGMELPRDKDLLWIAQEGLTKPLLKEWRPCRTEDDEIYYFNFKTGDSQWDHPCDEIHRNLLKAELQKLGRNLATKQSINDETELSSLSQDLKDEHQEKEKNKEKKESEVVVPSSKQVEVHQSQAGNADKTKKQMDDTDERPTSYVSKKQHDEEEEGGKVHSTGKVKKRIEQIEALTCGSKKEEEKQMGLQKAEMMEKAKREVDEERSKVQAARKAMQERVKIIINKDESELSANEPLKMPDAEAKQKMKAEISKYQRKFKIKVDNAMDHGRIPIIKEEDENIPDGTIKQREEENAVELAQSTKKMHDVKLKKNSDQEDREMVEVKQGQESSKVQQNHQIKYEEEDYSPFNLPSDDKQKKKKNLDEQLLEPLLNPMGSYKQQGLDSNMLQSDLSSSIALKKKELFQQVKEKLKLEEVKLYDQLKEKMITHVHEEVNAIEKNIFEEEYWLLKLKFHNRANMLYEKLMQDMEFQLLQEKEHFLTKRREDMQRRLSPYKVFDIPVASSSDGSLATKGWIYRDQKNHNSKVELMTQWKNPKNSHSSQVDAVEEPDNLRGRNYLRSSSSDLEGPLNSNNHNLPSTWWDIPSEEEMDAKVENLWN